MLARRLARSRLARALARTPLPWVALVVAAVVGCQAPAGSGPAPTAAPADTASSPLTATPPSPTGDIAWVERLAGGAEEAPGLPLVVGIHGLGDAPERFCRLFDELRARARVACPRGFSRHGAAGWSWFPPRAAQGDRPRLLAEAADRLALAVSELATKRGAPRVVVTGFSQGGALAFALAVRHPEGVARAVPIGGWLPAPLRPGPGAPTAPILALHGEVDRVVPLEPTREAVDALVAAGHSAELRVFPGVAHTVPPEVRSALFGAIAQALDAGPEKRERGAP